MTIITVNFNFNRSIQSIYSTSFIKNVHSLYRWQLWLDRNDGWIYKNRAESPKAKTPSKPKTPMAFNYTKPKRSESEALGFSGLYTAEANQSFVSRIPKANSPQPKKPSLGPKVNCVHFTLNKYLILMICPTLKKTSRSTK